ncbi:hypothetical protein ACFV27_00380 [Streptomyces antimycoticus]|uniref:hypothetical protein n=1 Tax=Streptomyces antimycoticus TaxID=68175 RepID=UPI000A37BAC9|nr:hypothetical protein [Streptomyces antimycoticus]WTB08055.1 hypothetical protein OG546_29805 [Streptomyces antimycoticus]
MAPPFASTLATALLLAGTALAGCGSGGPGSSDDGSLDVWVYHRRAALPTPTGKDLWFECRSARLAPSRARP